jgi:hypothetical protein
MKKLLFLLMLLTFNSVLADPVVGTYATISDNQVTLGQLVIIRLEPHIDRQLTFIIADGTNTYRYNGQQLSNTIGFSPQRVGEHELRVRDTDGTIIERLHFLVAEEKNTTLVPIDAIITNNTNTTVLPTRTHYLETDKTTYDLGESVTITLLEQVPGARLLIVFDEQVFRFLGDIPDSSSYQPRHPGSYRVVLSGPDSSTLDSFVFTVRPPQEITAELSSDESNFTKEFRNTTQKFKVRNAKGLALDGTIAILPHSQRNGIMAGMLDAQKLSITEPSDVEFTPESDRIKRVRIHNVVAQTIDLGIDEFSDEPIALPVGADERYRRWTTLYAVDPTGLNATNVTIVITATGNELLTCKDWDYTNRACLGAWIKVRDVIPGENYTITIDPTDPGFGEMISIPSGGWTETVSGETFTISVCTTVTCTNRSTVFAAGDTVYVQFNVSPSYTQNTTKNQLDIYSGTDTGSLYSATYFCVGTQPNGPFTSCRANFTIDPIWGEGWFYIDSEVYRSTGGGIYTSFRTPLIVGTEPQHGDSLKFFADSAYTIETEIFPQGTQMYVEFNFSEGTASAANTVPLIRDIETIQGTGGTTVTESFSNTAGPYRFNFSMPALTANNWYFLDPALENTSGGIIPAGTAVHGRMFLFQTNNIPTISAITTNSNFTNPVSVGQHINWSINITDSNEVDKWIVFVCTNNSFNNITRTCATGAVICSNITYSRIMNRTCDVVANSSMNITTKGFAFVCDARNCSSGMAINWSVYNDTRKPTITLITPINDPLGNAPRTSFSTQFNFVPADDYGLANCSLFSNVTGSFARTATNYTITNGTNNLINHTFPRDGSYLWNVECVDYAGNLNYSATNFTFLITGPPIVNLNLPKNDSHQNSQSIFFSYNVTYSQNISQCSLLINGTVNDTNANISLGTQQNFTASFATDGSYRWNINCTAIDGNSSLGDGVYNVSIDRTLFIDTTAPNVTLLNPGDLAVINVSSVDFTFTANDAIALDSCSLYVDGIVASTMRNIVNDATNSISFLLNNGNHPWYVTCNDTSANSVTSTTRSVIVNSSASGSAQFYETNLGTATTITVPGSINLSTSTDGTEASLATSIATTTMAIMTRAITTPFQGNGIIVTANSVVNFSGMFSASRANEGRITWKLYKSNSTTDTLIAEAGDDSTGGTLITATAKAAYRASATAPSTAVRILGTEWVKLQVDIYNQDNRRRTFTHYIDNTSSYVIFNFTRLGVMSTAIVSPALNLTIGTNETFNFRCAYNCSGGSCINTKIYLELNTTTGWIAINNTGGLILLNGTETNPHSFTEVSFPGNTTTFTLLSNLTRGISRVRCNAISDYSNATVLDTRVINISTLSIPTLLLIGPANASYVNTNSINFTFLLSSNKNITNCSLFIRNTLNATNQSQIILDITNNITVSGFAEGPYNWSISCFNVNGTKVNSTVYNFTVDRGPPLVDLNAPVNNSNFTTDTLTFNWTATDTSPVSPVCNISIDNVVRATNVPSANGIATTTSIGGLTIGVHRWNATCLDAAGNRNTSAVWQFNITNLPTNVTLLNPANGTWNSSSTILFFFNVTHPANQQPANCTIFFNGVRNQTNSTSIRMNLSNNITVSTLSDGKYNWYVNCTSSDNLTNVSPTRTIIIDTTGPHINLTSPLNNSVLGIFNIPFSFNVTDALSPNMTCNLSLDSAVNITSINIRNNTYNITTINDLDDGLHNWSVSCIDFAGNRNTSLVFNFTLIAPPNVTLVSPANASYVNRRDVNLTYNVTENNNIRNCTLFFDNAFNMSNQTPILNGLYNNFTLLSVQEGRHNWSVSCTDAGPYQGNSSVYNFTIDVTKANVELNTPANNTLWRVPVITVNWTATDNIDLSLTCSVTRKGPDGTDNSKANIASLNGTPTTTIYSGLPDGQHMWNVTCLDDASNSNFSVTYQFNISSLPSVTPVFPSHNMINNSQYMAFIYVPTQTYGIANCSLIINNDINYTNYTITNGGNNFFNISGFNDGVYNWSINCTDVTGGTQNSSTRNFTIDTVSPFITLNSPPSGVVITNNTVLINYTPVDTRSSSMTCNVTVNGTTYGVNSVVTNATSNVTAILLHGGSRTYLWNVTCVDIAGNFNTSVSRTFVMYAPPNVTLVSPANNSPSSQNTTFFYRPTDPFGLQNCTLLIDGIYRNSSNIIINASLNNLSADNIATGRHNWSIMCNDTDNDTFTTDVYWFSSDNGIPSITLNAPADGVTFNTGNITVNWSAIDDFSDNMSCYVYVDNINRTGNVTLNNSWSVANLSLLNDGTRQWNVTCFDVVGNQNWSETRNVVINQTPYVLQVFPNTGNNTNNPSVKFNFSVYDNDGFANCSIILNGGTVVANGTPMLNRQTNNITTTLGTGQYNWSVLCADNGTFNLYNWTTNRTLIVNLIPPNISLDFPADGYVTNLSWIEFNWTANETFGGALTCNITINGTFRGTNIAVSSGVQKAFNVTWLNDSYHVWNVTCLDPAGNVNTSSSRSFVVVAPPVVTQNGPANNLRTNNLTINFTFTPNDNSGIISACSLIINGDLNNTVINLPNGTTTNITVPGFVNGTYRWLVNCTDKFYNMGNSTNRTLLIDTLPPTIALNRPQNNTAWGTNITFNWTANDSGTVITCNLTLDGVVNVSNIVGTSGVDFTRFVSDIPEGPHQWNVTCRDDLGITNTSLTYDFTVLAPDLIITTARVLFNNTNPGLNDIINISANVTNNGGVAATNANISFWDGNPASGGVYLGSNLLTVQPSQNVTTSISWPITAGFHQIYAIADIDDIIFEVDESNNNASRNISVLRVVFYSPTNGSITKNQTPAVNFTVLNYTGGEFSWRVFVDGIATSQNGTITDDISLNISLNTLSEGRRSIIVQANDSTRFKNSTPLIIYIDITPPVATFVTRNGTFFQQSPLNISINVTDNLANSVNASILVNGIYNASAIVANATPTNSTLVSLPTGIYNLTIQTFDNVSNYANSTNITIYVDNLKPIITLNSPLNDTNFTVRTVALNFTPSDDLDSLLMCNLSLDNSNIMSYANITNGAHNVTVASGLSEGSHSWYATCWDGNNGILQINNINTSATWTFGVYIAPNITLIRPANNNISNNATQIFIYNASDETGFANCSLLINGTFNMSNQTPIRNYELNNFTLNGLNNTLNWSVVCVDNSSGNAVGYTNNFTLTIDLVSPVPIINTPENTWFKNSTPSINITVTDNFDTILNWSFFVDGNINTNGSIGSGVTALVGLSGLANGVHTIILQAYDDAGNFANSSPRVIYVDTITPNVTLLVPINDSNLSTTLATLNFTASDNLAQVLLCNLSLDGVLVQQYNLTNGTNASFTTASLASGYHYWNVTCIDNATNIGNSETWRFFIQLPDLTITSGNMSLSNNTPIENQTITVNATIFNIGQLNVSSNITVNLYRGNPETGGLLLSTQNITGLNITHNATLTFNYTTIIGLNYIFIAVDPPVSTNGSINESNETNNLANLTVWVGLFEVFAGTSLNELHIADSAVIPAFTWNASNITGSNVFVADSGSVLSFTSLRAIGLNITNGTSVGVNDFEEIDQAIGATSLNDSINRSFTSAGTPIAYVNLTAFRRSIVNVPIINSTNTSSFITGILWDASDGGNFYNKSQDIVFVTVMNQTKVGAYGTYDYEIAVPATLRDYIPGGGTVAFYTELR